MKKTITILSIILIIIILLILIFPIIYFGFTLGTDSKELIESVKSPNKKYTINTYLTNCGATCDFGIIAELCDKNNKCKKIYDYYHENTSFVYWIDNENIFINQKKLNVFKDVYESSDNDTAFKLYATNDKAIYLINKDGFEYKLTGNDVTYITEVATSMFNFKNSNMFNDYDFIIKIVDLDTNQTIQYFLKINNKKMYIINNNKLSKLNRTDYEYLKKVLISNNLYTFK